MPHSHACQLHLVCTQPRGEAWRIKLAGIGSCLWRAATCQQTSHNGLKWHVDTVCQHDVTTPGTRQWRIIPAVTILSSLT